MNDMASIRKTRGLAPTGSFAVRGGLALSAAGAAVSTAAEADAAGPAAFGDLGLREGKTQV